MPTLAQLKLLADPTRLRLMRLLCEEELSVSELQQLLGMGQSRVSSQLAQLRSGDLVKVQKQGKITLYGLANLSQELLALVYQASTSVPEVVQDLAAVDWIRSRRQDKARAYFDQLAGKFGRDYVPGRSWKALAEALLFLIEPDLIIADLGAGEATLSQLLCARSKQVIAVDLSEKMVAYGRQLAAQNGLENFDYRQGDLENPPLEDGSVDVVIFAQALHHASQPERALENAFQSLKIGGRMLILDLNTHRYEQARDLYGDVHLGFSQGQLARWLGALGMTNIHAQVVDTQQESPKFETLLATAVKAS